MFLSRMPGPAAPERWPPFTSESPSRAEEFLAETGHGGARGPAPGRGAPRPSGQADMFAAESQAVPFRVCIRKAGARVCVGPGLPEAESAPPEEPWRAAVLTPNGAALAVTPRTRIVVAMCPAWLLVRVACSSRVQ